MQLKISNLSKRVADKWILRDVSFEVSEGEIFGLIGEDGAEKSMVLHLINNAKNPNTDEISFSGESNKTAPQLFPIVRKTNFWENLFKQKNGMPAAQKIRTDFENVLKNPAKILLLDNPFCCLNEQERLEIFENLRSVVQNKNLSVIFASNNSEDVFALCDRVGVIHKGEIVQTGTPREIYEKPNSQASASALGRYNFIQAMRVTFNNQASQEFQTLTGEHRLQTDKSEKRQLGAINSAVTLAIRPEHISLSFGASFPEDNLLKAKIAAVNYCGATTRVILDANGLKLEALVLRLVGLNVGDECMVGLPPDRILVLKS